MKKAFVRFLVNIQTSDLFFIAFLILLCVSCKKEDNSNINFKFRSNEIIYYPDKHISLTFQIIPEGYTTPYKLKWFNPDSLKEEGPHTIKTTTDVLLDFEIINVKNESKRFTYEIITDTIDSVNYDYRNKYIGSYCCNVTSSYNGSTNHYLDTLTVVKNDSFIIINIKTNSDILHNYEGNMMTYSNSNGYYSFPTGEFYGYHSGVIFSNDSIHCTVSGPLGYYYTNVYDGIKILQ